jgi:hypothetical protein
MEAVVTFAEKAGSALFVSQIEQFSNELGLSEQQEDKLRSLIEERLSDLRPIVADLVVARSITIPQLLRPHGRFECLMRQLTQEKADATLKNILSPGQFRKLRKMRAANIAYFSSSSSVYTQARNCRNPAP